MQMYTYLFAWVQITHMQPCTHDKVCLSFWARDIPPRPSVVTYSGLKETGVKFGPEESGRGKSTCPHGARPGGGGNMAVQLDNKA